MKRSMLIGGLAAGITCLVGSVVLWVVLSSWVPTNGKALLIRTLEQQAPVTVSIQAMRYGFFRGFILERVQVADRASQELWLSTPRVDVSVQWLPLLFGGTLAFRAQAPIDAPCPTDLSLLGRYHLRTKSLTLDVRTADVSLSTLAAPLKRHVPPGLADGTVQAILHLTQWPAQPLTMSGRIIGTHLTWSAPPVGLRGDLTLNGNAQAPLRTGNPWNVQGLLSLRHGIIEGLPTIHTIREVEGTARLSDNRLEIEQLEGTALGSRWRLEGTVGPLAHPALEVLLSSRADIAALSTALSTLKEAWQLAGSSDVRAVCRGPLQPFPTLDCLVHADVRDVTLSGSKLTSPITHVTGSLDYDALTKRLSIAPLKGRIRDDMLSTYGEIRCATPWTFSLNVNGAVPLEALTGWLPSHGPVNQLAGEATVSLQIQGPTPQFQLAGQVALRGAGMRLSGTPHMIDRVTGLIRLTPEAITTEALSLQLDGHPVTLTTQVSYGATPHLIATALFDQGKVSLNARVTPQDIVIEEGEVSLAQSRVQVTGTYGRAEDRPSVLRLEGTVELGELAHLFFFPLPALEGWNLNGLAAVTAQFEGRLQDWAAATIQGRVRADRASVREIPLNQVTCAFEQRNRILRARIPSASVADGKFLAELTLEHRPDKRDYLLQTDVTGLQLAKLREVIPAWRSRAVNGMASGHTTLWGSWEERTGWRGEGWMNASGDGLGNIPLLDKVFRGLFGVLGDRLGLDALRHAQVTQASTQWRLSQERFATDNLRLAGLAGTEPVAVYAKGSVGFDQTLDFVIEPEFSERMLLRAPTTAPLASTILKAAGQLDRLRRLIGRHRLTGTLSHPEYRFELSSQEVFKQLGPAPADLLQNLLDVVR